MKLCYMHVLWVLLRTRHEHARVYVHECDHTFALLHLLLQLLLLKLQQLPTTHYLLQLLLFLLPLVLSTPPWA